MVPFDPDEALLGILETMDASGWSIVAVGPDPDDLSPEYAYTVGLTTIGNPELVITGLPAQLAGRLLNQVAERITQGQVIGHGDRLDDVLAEGHELAVIEVTDMSELGIIAAVYGHADRALQLVWPDPEDRMPWQRGYSMAPSAQPLFGTAFN